MVKKIFVRFVEGTEYDYSIEAIEFYNNVNVNLTRDYTHYGVTGLTVLEIPDDKVQTALNFYNTAAYTHYVEEDTIIELDVLPSVIPNDPSFSSQWGLKNTTGNTWCSLDAEYAWDITTGSSDVIVAIVDTGIEYTHEDLVDNMWTDPITGYYGYDFVNDDNYPMDDNGHGTHCAGIIGATGNNGIGVTGVCWTVKLMAVKVMNSSGTGNQSDIIDGIAYATSKGAHIISMSLGGLSTSRPQAWYDVIAASTAVVVCSAGNSKYNIDDFSSYPASFSIELDNVIAVASCTDLDVLSSFSNIGIDTVDVVAPGSSIYSTYIGNTFATMSGTSMACPFVSGTCALIKSVFITDTAAQIKERILNCVEPAFRDGISAYSGKIKTGGRINAYNAVSDALPLPIANFNPSSKISNIYEPILFTNYTRNTDIYPTTYLWDFDDGTTSTEQHPIHQYTAPGEYGVKLTVTQNEITHHWYYYYITITNYNAPIRIKNQYLCEETMFQVRKIQLSSTNNVYLVYGKDNIGTKFNIVKIYINPRNIISVLFDKTYGGITGSSFPYDLIETNDGGYAIIGYTTSIDGDIIDHHVNGANDACVMKLDSNGDLEWIKCIGGTQNTLGLCINQTSDNGYIIGGRTLCNDGDFSGDSTSFNLPFAAKLSSTGVIDWCTAYYGGAWTQFEVIKQLPNGHYIAGGASGGIWACLMELNSDGSMVWGEYNYPAATINNIIIKYNEYYPDIIDNYIVAGYTEPLFSPNDYDNYPGGYCFFMAAVDLEGVIAWKYAYGGSNEDFLSGIDETLDGGYILSGETISNDKDVSGNHGNTNRDAWIVKVSSTGIIEWQKCIGGTSYDSIYFVKQLTEHNYIAGGSFSSADGDMDGNIGIKILELDYNNNSRIILGAYK